LRKRQRVVCPGNRRNTGGASLAPVARANQRRHQFAAGALGKIVRAFGKNTDDPSADGAESGDGDPQRPAHSDCLRAARQLRVLPSCDGGAWL